jgi:glycosyltransferase involved in cell wall biosynthesis
VTDQRPIRVLELRSVWGTGGGPEKTIIMGAARTDRRRFAVTVCYLRDERDPVFGVASRLEGVEIDYAEVRERHSFDPGIWRRLRALVRERRIDIVHAHDYKTDLLALALARAEKVVPLTTVHGWTGHTRREQVYYWADKRLIARYPRVVAVSSEIRDELVRTGTPADRITVILNGIDPAAFTRDPAREPEARALLGLPLGRTIVGAVGRLAPQKRFDLLIEAFARLRPGRLDLFLAIAGDGELRADLEARAAASALGPDAFRLLGHQADVALVHHAFDLFVQSSKYEGTPNAVLEAMAMETPFVATDVGGTAELAHDRVHALIVPPNDVDSLVMAVTRMLDDPPAARARAAAARARVEGPLSFASRMAHLEAVYEELFDRLVHGRDARASKGAA